MKIPLIVLLVITSLTISSASNAGFAGGPYFLWLNLSDNKHIDKILNKNLDKKEDCGEPNMKIVPLPDWISRDLIEKAMLRGDKSSIAALDRVMKKKYPEYSSQGLDGVIAYSDAPKPQFLNFVRGRKGILKDPLPRSANDQSIWEAFCLMVPPITRPI